MGSDDDKFKPGDAIREAVTATFEPGSTGEAREPRQHPAEQTWELISEAAADGVGTRLDRIRVPGGWLYRTITEMFDTGGLTAQYVDVAYVPDRRVGLPQVGQRF